MIFIQRGVFVQDGKGRTVDFTNTIIVLTSSIGAQYILEEVENPSSTTKSTDGKLSQTIKDRVIKEVRLSWFFVD